MKTEYKIESDNKKGEAIKLSCNHCKTETNHEYLHNYYVHITQHIDLGDGYEASVDGYDDHQILKCAGCDSVSFRHEAWFSEDEMPGLDDGTVTHLYPKRNELLLLAKDHPHVPAALKRIYRETIDAFNSESYTLTAAGLRAIVEGICGELKIKDGPVLRGTTTKREASLEGKIKGLQEKGLLTVAHADALDHNRVVGNIALHELQQLSPEELRLALNIVEHTFDNVFQLPQTHSNLKRKLAKRLKKGSNKKKLANQ